MNESELAILADKIKQWGQEFGFQQVGISNTQLDKAESHLNRWLESGYHGSMTYMSRHGSKRSRPQELVPGTISIISARMDYLPRSAADPQQVLESNEKAYIARYALGRDYHKVLRNRLKKLANKIEQSIGRYSYRVFTDSAPVLEKAIGENSGIGWIGKHSNLIHKKFGSWFFLGEIYTDLPLPTDSPTENHCGRCTSCIDVCPTNAIIKPYQVDARLCISYLTIENRGPIPEKLRPLLGNRIYGCDDCQLVCPWNKFAMTTDEKDFLPRHKLDAEDLLTLFAWTEREFLDKTEGSPIRRTGYEGWLRNLAVALGNTSTTKAVIKALKQRIDFPSDMVVEHVYWALKQHGH